MRGVALKLASAEEHARLQAALGRPLEVELLDLIASVVNGLLSLQVDVLSPKTIGTYLILRSSDSAVRGLEAQH